MGGVSKISKTTYKNKDLSRSEIKRTLNNNEGAYKIEWEPEDQCWDITVHNHYQGSFEVKSDAVYVTALHLLGMEVR